MSSTTPVQHTSSDNYYELERITQELSSQLFSAIEKNIDRLMGKLLTYTESLSENDSVTKARKDMIRQIVFNDDSWNWNFNYIIQNFNRWIIEQQENYDKAKDHGTNLLDEGNVFNGIDLNSEPKKDISVPQGI